MKVEGTETVITVAKVKILETEMRKNPTGISLPLTSTMFRKVMTRRQNVRMTTLRTKSDGAP